MNNPSEENKSVKTGTSVEPPHTREPGAIITGKSSNREDGDDQLSAAAAIYREKKSVAWSLRKKKQKDMEKALRHRPDETRVGNNGQDESRAEESSQSVISDALLPSMDQKQALKNQKTATTIHTESHGAAVPEARDTSDLAFPGSEMEEASLNSQDENRAEESSQSTISDALCRSTDRKRGLNRKRGLENRKKATTIESHDGAAVDTRDTSAMAFTGSEMEESSLVAITRSTPMATSEPSSVPPTSIIHDNTPLIEAQLVPDPPDENSSALPDIMETRDDCSSPADNDSAVIEAKPLKLLSRKRTVCLFAGLLLLIAAVALAVILVVFLGRGGGHGKEDDVSLEETKSFPPTLERVRKAGVLRCSGIQQQSYGISSFENVFYEGNLELVRIPSVAFWLFCIIATCFGSLRHFLFPLQCKAIAAAALGPDFRVEYRSMQDGEAIKAMENRTIDVMVTGPFRSIQLDVAGNNGMEDGHGLSFSTPYMYASIYVYGTPHYAKCFMDGPIYKGNCSGIRVCLVDHESGSWLSRSLYMTPIPRQYYVEFSSLVDMAVGFVNETCNVFYFPKINLLKDVLGVVGYSGELARYPLYHAGQSLITLDEDLQWSNFVNAAIYAALAAEQLNITQETAYLMPETDAFGDPYRRMYIDAISVAGNYQEFYARTVEPFYPRGDINQLNTGNTGLMTTLTGFYSYFYGYEDIGPGPKEGGTLESILERGQLRCAIRGDRPGFAWYDKTNNSTDLLVGLDVDMCRAVAAALFFGDTSEASIAWTEVQEEEDPYALLARSEVDVAAGVTWTINAQMKERTTGQAFSFSRPYFYGPVDRGEASEQ
jgi:ABC-type amino acid transport substrate-binding protein